MVPTMWAAMMTSEDVNAFDLGSLRIVISGGSPLLTHIKEALLKRFPHAGLKDAFPRRKPCFPLRIARPDTLL